MNKFIEKYNELLDAFHDEMTIQYPSLNKLKILQQKLQILKSAKDKCDIILSVAIKEVS